MGAPRQAWRGLAAALTPAAGSNRVLDTTALPAAWAPGAHTYAPPRSRATAVPQLAASRKAVAARPTTCGAPSLMPKWSSPENVRSVAAGIALASCW
jgi:hypothetical protein